MTAAEETYYTDERWTNWLERLEEEDLDPEDEESARLLLNLQDDAAIAVAKILTDYDEGRLDHEEAVGELERVRDIVLGECDIEDEEKLMLIDGVQTSLVCVFYAAEEYIHAGAATEASVEEYVTAAADAEADDDMDAALGYLVQAGTRIVDGDDLDMAVVEDIEYGLVSEWVNGLDSLQAALEDPEVVEEDDDGESGA
jgi:hypothetical protein